MGRLLIVVASGALAGAGACGHSNASGPKWPEPSKTAEDGGESIEPRPSASYAAAVEKSDDNDEDKPAASSTSSPASSTSEDKPATTSTPTTPTSEDVFQTDEIIIEIDD
ncbi:MAG TPA: hypothetical protein VFV99_32225 [Kofleriaceae bacterium]|nr:hypothetical protein [Kofleriaceae bacterium]